MFKMFRNSVRSVDDEISIRANSKSRPGSGMKVSPGPLPGGKPMEGGSFRGSAGGLSTWYVLRKVELKLVDHVRGSESPAQTGKFFACVGPHPSAPTRLTPWLSTPVSAV